MSDAFPDSDLIKSKMQSILRTHEGMIEFIDDELQDKEGQISDLESDNRDLGNEVTDLETELDEANEKISGEVKTLEDDCKNELFEELSKKYSLVQLTEILKPFL